MKKGFVVSAVLYPLLIIALTLIMGVISMSDNRRKILDNMKLEVSEESETDPEMTNSSLYYKMKVLEEAYAELNSRFSEEYFEQIKAQAKLETFPVGSIYISTTSTNPSSYIGGTWEAYGQGRTLVGTGSNGTTNYSLGTTGGSETSITKGKLSETTLTADQIPSHVHRIPALSGTAANAGGHTHTRGTMEITGSIGSRGSSEPKFGAPSGAFYAGVTTTYYSKTTNVEGYPRWDGFNFAASRTWSGATSNSGDHSHTITTTPSSTDQNAGGKSHTHTFLGEAISNISPYVTVYFWRRKA